MDPRRAKRTNPWQVLAFRPPEALREAIVRWLDHQADKPPLSEAVRRLVELGLAASGGGDNFGDSQKIRAREMAADTIDDVSDATATPEGRAARKRDLLNGPKEFTDVRVDRAGRGKLIG